MGLDLKDKSAAYSFSFWMTDAMAQSWLGYAWRSLHGLGRFCVLIGANHTTEASPVLEQFLSVTKAMLPGELKHTEKSAFFLLKIITIM